MNLIGLLFPNLSNPYFPQLIDGIEGELKRRGYTVLLGRLDNKDEFPSYLRTFENNNIAGIISSAGIIPAQKVSVPIVEVDRISQNSKYFVTTNDFLGGSLIGDNVARTVGTTNIAIIKGPNTSRKSIDRFEGLCSVLLKYPALKITEIASNTFDIKLVDSVIKQIFDLDPFPDTIIAQNDLYAIVILQELLKRGIKVPEQTQVIGYDGINFLDLIYPRIATVEQPIYELGSETANLMVQIIENSNLKETQIQLDVKFSAGATLRPTRKEIYH